MSISLFRIGQALQGRLGQYIITKEIQQTVWFATNQFNKTVVVKAVLDHPRVKNELDVLKTYQHRSAHFRPLVDEILEPHDYPTIALKYLDDHLLIASIQRVLNRKELKHVSRCVLEALEILHKDGIVHTATDEDVKLDNVFVNYQEGENRFLDVQLGDFSGAYPQTSEWAKKGTPVGAAMWSSPEVIMETPWSTATDIWSFGTMIISLIYGGDFNLFRPKTVSFDDEEYTLEILKQQFQYFGPFPVKYEEIASPMTVTAILWLMNEIPKSKMTPFENTTEREVCKRDKEFLSRIMKLDWRDRPTASQLLEDGWFEEDDRSQGGSKRDAYGE